LEHETISNDCQQLQTSPNSQRSLSAMTTRLTLAIISLTVSLHADSWPQWRGPNQDGSTTATGLPTQFSLTDGVKWSAPLPSSAASSPVVVGNKVFVSAIDVAAEKLLGIAIDAETGRELWRKAIGTGYKWDKNSNLASPSPAADAANVYFFFATGDLHAFTHDGQEVWARSITKDHGNFGTQWTYSSSATLDHGKLYVQVLQRDEAFEFQGSQKGTPGGDNRSYILCINAETGQDVWKHYRPSDAVAETLEAFSSPVFHDHEGKRQMLIVGGDCITGHDAATGAELWRWGSWNPEKIGHWRLVPSVVAGDGVALACAPKNNPIFALPLGKTGLLKDTDLYWTSDPKEVTSDVSTPLYYQGYFYVLDSGRKTFSCIETKTGKVLWTGETDSKAKFESSPTAADGKIYATNFWGDVYVVAANPAKFELLHVAEMGNGTRPQGNDESVRASVAIANNRLYIRTQDKLHCVGN
jgi:outer membrane protein assembly factor BamB